MVLPEGVETLTLVSLDRGDCKQDAS